MKRFLILTLFLLLIGCKPEIKNPEDIIASDAKAVIYIPKVEEVLNLEPFKNNWHVGMLRGGVEGNKSAALVLTSVDPLVVYCALPAKGGQDEELQKLVSEYSSLESDFWSGYVFVSLKGSLPSSFGNKEFLPQDQSSIIYAKANVQQLIENNEEKLASYRKYNRINSYGYKIPYNEILTRFLTHNLADFAEEIEHCELDLNSEDLTLKINLKENSQHAENYNSMKDFKLPGLSSENSDIAFSSSVDFSKLDFPLNGFETAFKSYLSSINKGDVIFTMDSVFNKLREAKQVRSSGYFKINGNTLTGQTVFKAENQQLLSESTLKFLELMAPEFFSEIKEEGSVKSAQILRSLTLPGKTVDSKMTVNVEPEVITVSDSEVQNKELSLSEENGLFSLLVNTELLTNLDFGKKKAVLKVTVENNVIHLKAGLK